jgi:hypothetical protein
MVTSVCERYLQFGRALAWGPYSRFGTRPPPTPTYTPCIVCLSFQIQASSFELPEPNRYTAIRIPRNLNKTIARTNF